MLFASQRMVVDSQGGRFSLVVEVVILNQSSSSMYQITLTAALFFNQFKSSKGPALCLYVCISGHCILFDWCSDSNWT